MTVHRFRDKIPPLLDYVGSEERSAAVVATASPSCRLSHEPSRQPVEGSMCETLAAQSGDDPRKCRSEVHRTSERLRHSERWRYIDGAVRRLQEPHIRLRCRDSAFGNQPSCRPKSWLYVAGWRVCRSLGGWRPAPTDHDSHSLAGSRRTSLLRPDGMGPRLRL